MTDNWTETFFSPMDDELYCGADEIHTLKDNTDGDGLPSESFESYSELPLDFEEMASGLSKDLREVYELTGTLNRFSQHYPVVCRLMEKLIRRLGSCLVTKTALERRGFDFPALKGLDIHELYCMVSFNFRKTRTAFHEGKQEKGCADMGLLEQECRLTDLAERLKSTEEKIRQIKAGMIDYENLISRSQIFIGQKGVIREKTDHKLPTSGKAPSLPVIGSVFRQMVREQNERKKEEAEDLEPRGSSIFRTSVFKPARLKDLRNRNRTDKQPDLPVRSSEEKDNGMSENEDEKLTDYRGKPKSGKDAALETEFDETMRSVFEKYKRLLGGNGAPLTGRA